MTEIDRFFRQAMYDPAATRVQRGDPAAHLHGKSNVQRQRELFRHVKALLVLMFNDPRPSEQLSIVCGRSPEYWARLIDAGRINKEALRLLCVGLRAHITGIRDHLNDVDAEVRRLTDALDDRSLFALPEAAQAAAKRARLRRRAP